MMRSSMMSDLTFDFMMSDLTFEYRASLLAFVHANNVAVAARLQTDRTARGNTASATSTDQPVNLLTGAGIKRLFPWYDLPNNK